MPIAPFLTVPTESIDFINCSKAMYKCTCFQKIASPIKFHECFIIHCRKKKYSFMCSVHATSMRTLLSAMSVTCIKTQQNIHVSQINMLTI